YLASTLLTRIQPIYAYHSFRCRRTFELQSSGHGYCMVRAGTGCDLAFSVGLRHPARRNACRSRLADLVPGAAAADLSHVQRLVAAAFPERRQGGFSAG